MNYDRPELLDRLAAEYVLGTLRGGARSRFDRLQRQLPAARIAVAGWEARLNSLGTTVPATAVPGRVWDAIVERTGSSRATAPTPRRWGWLKPALRPVWPEQQPLTWDELTTEMNGKMQFPGWTKANRVLASLDEQGITVEPIGSH